MFVIGEHAVLSGSIAAKQPIPLRVYCGIRKSEEGKFRICSNAQEYWISLQAFQATKLPSGLTDGVEDRVVEILTSLLGKQVFGVEAEFLSEAPLYSGLGTSGAMAAALIT